MSRNTRRSFAASASHLGSVTLAACVVSGALGCTEADLFIPPVIQERVVDNKIGVSGGFCAEGASDLEAFLKIMLIVDRSNSMNVTDPVNLRVDAARDLVMRFIADPITFELRAGVEIAVISFFGSTVVHTRNSQGLVGYSTEGPEILFGITQLSQTGSNTGYDKALAQAFTIIDSDMAKLSGKAKNLSRYETIFVSDGMPYPDNCRGEPNSPSAGVDAVGRLKALSTAHKVRHRFHAVYLTDPAVRQLGLNASAFKGIDGEPCGSFDARADPSSGISVGQATRELLNAMSVEGTGTFTEYDNGDAITFEGFEFADARRIFALSNFMASNINARPAMNRMVPDSDGDGLSDAEEYLLGSSPYLTDSDGDGFRDGMEWRFRLSGFDPLDPTDGRCDELSLADTDHDGLRDCEETIIGSRSRSYDTDADGMPDEVEFLFGSNPASATPLQDGQNDADADGGDDADELRWHTDPNLDDVASRSKLAYDYRQSELPITSGRACYDFDIRNITLASTRSAPENQEPDGVVDPAGWNRVMFYFAQTPYDEPLSEPLYRVACVDARYVESRDLKIPATGRMSLPPLRPSDTFRADDVLSPNGARCYASVNQDCGLDTIWCRFSDDGGTCTCYDPPSAPGDSADGVNPRPCPVCSNGRDDDGDGKTDFPYDPDCFDSTDTSEATDDECSDGIDNDGDERIDWPNDPGCANGEDLVEGDDPAVPPECANGADDDADGATDFPNDAGCYAAVDATEGQSLLNPQPACGDGVDNDGDGLIDFGQDPGCADAIDLDEDGPAVCFFCELFTDTKPGQCNFASGHCRPRAGSACTSNIDCRGAVCDARTSACRPCLGDIDCNIDASGTPIADGPSVCDARMGWCLTPVFTVTPCTSDAECSAGACDTDLGFCSVDPYYACGDDDDCSRGSICSKERGFCLENVFETRQCGAELPCDAGTCDEQLGWCLPVEGSEQCNHDDECPYGDCRSAGFCDQQTFVFPDQFRPDVDCIIAR